MEVICLRQDEKQTVHQGQQDRLMSSPKDRAVTHTLQKCSVAGNKKIKATSLRYSLNRSLPNQSRYRPVEIYDCPAFYRNVWPAALGAWLTGPTCSPECPRHLEQLKLTRGKQTKQIIRTEICVLVTFLFYSTAMLCFSTNFTLILVHMVVLLTACM